MIYHGLDPLHQHVDCILKIVFILVTSASQTYGTFWARTYEPHHKKTTMWFPDRSDTNRAVQAQKMDRGWKFWI